MKIWTQTLAKLVEPFSGFALGNTFGKLEIFIYLDSDWCWKLEAQRKSCYSSYNLGLPNNYTHKEIPLCDVARPINYISKIFVRKKPATFHCTAHRLQYKSGFRFKKFFAAPADFRESPNSSCHEQCVSFLYFADIFCLLHIHTQAWYKRLAFSCDCSRIFVLEW